MGRGFFNFYGNLVFFYFNKSKVGFFFNLYVVKDCFFIIGGVGV